MCNYHYCIPHVYLQPAKHSFLTRELRMRNTSYRELWENVSLDRSIRCKLYANEVRTRLTIKLLVTEIRISRFKGLN